MGRIASTRSETFTMNWPLVDAASDRNTSASTRPGRGRVGRQLAGIDGIDRDVVPVGRARDGVDRRQPFETASSIRSRQVFAHDDERLSCIAIQVAHVQRERVERRGRDLGPELLDPRRRAGNVVAFVIVPRRVVALSPAEVQDRLPIPLPVACQADREERIERPHDHQRDRAARGTRRRSGGAPCAPARNSPRSRDSRRGTPPEDAYWVASPRRARRRPIRWRRADPAAFALPVRMNRASSIDWTMPSSRTSKSADVRVSTIRPRASVAMTSSRTGRDGVVSPAEIIAAARTTATAARKARITNATYAVTRNPTSSLASPPPSADAVISTTYSPGASPLSGRSI